MLIYATDRTYLERSPDWTSVKLYVVGSGSGGKKAVSGGGGGKALLASNSCVICDGTGTRFVSIWDA